MRFIQQSQRRGFTMIELMIVIAIIALLLSLTVGAMFSFIVGAREAATSSTIAKVNQLLQDRVANFRQMDFTDAAQRYQASWNANYASSPALQIGSVELAEIIVRKYRMKKSFPQNLFEASSDPNRFSTMVNTLSSPPAGYVAKYESGIVLYALLFSGETFGAPSASDDLFSSSEVRISTETANLPCLVDAWGEPLRFYRWPTRLIRPQGVTAAGVVTPIDRTYARFLMSNIGPVNGLGADGGAGVNGAGPVGAYGSDDIPNVGPDGSPGIAGSATVNQLGAIGSDDYEPLNVDSDDPSLLLLSFLNAGLVTPTIFEQGNTTNVVYWPALHTPFTFHSFLILSAGADRTTGLYEPSGYPVADPNNFGYLAAPDLSTGQTINYLSDDISNLNLTGSGK